MPPSGERIPQPPSGTGGTVSKRRTQPKVSDAKAGAVRRAGPLGTCVAPQGADLPAPKGAGADSSGTMLPPPLRGVSNVLAVPFWGELEDGPARRLKAAGVGDARDLASLYIASLAGILG